MDVFGCDYACRTVGESMTKYNIPDDWCAEFDAYDDVYPIVCVPADQVRRNQAMMDLKLSVVEIEDDAYAGCMVRKEKKIIAFKIDRMSDLVKTMEE